MVKNPNWYGRDNGIDRIVFRVFTNSDAMVAAIQRGEIDAAHDIPSGSYEQLGADENIEVVDGQQGTFTELALNGMAGGIGDGHPALQDPTVRHAIFHAVNRDGLFQRVNLGLGAVGTTISPSADLSWIPDLGDENFTYDPDLANEMLDEAGYLDTDGDGVREMPDGSRPLEFRYAERSEGQNSSAIREFMIGFMEQIGVSLVVEVMDNSQLYDAQVRGEYDMFEWGWTPFVDPDPMLSYFTCDQVTTDPDESWIQRRQLVFGGVRRAVRAAEGRARPRPSARDRRRDAALVQSRGDVPRADAGPRSAGLPHRSLRGLDPAARRGWTRAVQQHVADLRQPHRDRGVIAANLR